MASSTHPSPKPKTLVLGAPRTGTTSVGLALEILGYNVHKSVAEAYTNPRHFGQFKHALRQKKAGAANSKAVIDSLVGEYDAVHGIAAVVLADDLLAAYPDAKVILTMREPDEWVESWDSSVIAFHKTMLGWRRWVWLCAGSSEREFQLFRETAIRAWSDGDPYDKVEQRRVYVEYYDHIREVVPQERLLEYKLQESWEPLCEFLGVKVPKDKTFPHAMKRSSLNESLQQMWQKAVSKVLVRVGFVFLMVPTVGWGLMYYRHMWFD